MDLVLDKLLFPPISNKIFNISDSNFVTTLKSTTVMDYDSCILTERYPGFNVMNPRRVVIDFGLLKS